MLETEKYEMGRQREITIQPTRETQSKQQIQSVRQVRKVVGPRCPTTDLANSRDLGFLTVSKSLFALGSWLVGCWECESSKSTMNWSIVFLSPGALSNPLIRPWDFMITLVGSVITGEYRVMSCTKENRVIQIINKLCLLFYFYYHNL